MKLLCVLGLVVLTSLPGGLGSAAEYEFSGSTMGPNPGGTDRSGSAGQQIAMAVPRPAIPWLNMTCQRLPIDRSQWVGKSYRDRFDVDVTFDGTNFGANLTWTPPKDDWWRPVKYDWFAGSYPSGSNPFFHIAFQSGNRYEKVGVCGPEGRLFIRIEYHKGGYQDFLGADGKLGLQRIQ